MFIRTDNQYNGYYNNNYYIKNCCNSVIIL